MRSDPTLEASLVSTNRNRKRRMDLSDYERTQAAEIAGWKSLRPSLLEASMGRLAASVYDRLGRIVPHTHVGPTLLKAFELAERIDTTGEIRGMAGVATIDEIKSWDLQQCDALVERIALKEQSIGLSEAALSEVGGLATEIMNMPIQAREVILLLRRVAHCYGYELNDERADAYLKTLIILGHETTVAKRLELLETLRRLESDTISDAELEAENQEIEAEIGAGFAEGTVMEFVPYLGILVSVYNDYEYFHHLMITARRVFQERHLRDLGKIDVIPPASQVARESTALNLFDFARELVYTGSFGMGYGAGFVGYGLMRLIRSNLPETARGIDHGAESAARDARQAAQTVAATTRGLVGIGVE
jgi:hypothetical protein